MKKKLLLMLFCISFSLFLTVSAEETELITEDIRLITEEEAINIFLENSYDIQKILIENQLLSLNYEDSKESLEDQLDEVNSSECDYEEAKEDNDEDDLEDIYYSQASQYAAQYKQFELTEFDINHLEEQQAYDIQEKVNDLKKDLYDYYLLKESLKLMEKKLELSEHEVDFAKGSYKNGTLSEIDLLDKQYAYDDLNLQKDQTMNQIILANEALKIKLGIPIDEDVDFVVSFEAYESSEELSVELIIDYYKSSNVNYLRQLEVIKATDNYITYLQEVYPSTNEDYIEAYYDYQIDQINNETSITNAINQLINTYYNYISMNRSFIITKTDLDLAKIEYDNQLITYNNGQISLYQLNQAEYSYLQAVNSYEKANIDLRNSIMDLLLMVYETIGE